MRGDDRNRRCRNPQIRSRKPRTDNVRPTPLGSTRNGNPSYIKVPLGFGKFVTQCCLVATTVDQVPRDANGWLTMPPYPLGCFLLQGADLNRGVAPRADGVMS